MDCLKKSIKLIVVTLITLTIGVTVSSTAQAATVHYVDYDKTTENIRKEIRNLGNVNLDSIKEYEHIKERHDFYSEQKKDLEQSIEVIEKLIYELEENMKKEFESNFNKINENFKFV